MDYTLSGKVVTFTTAPAAGVKVVCLSYANEFLDILSDQTVYTDNIKDDAVSDTKIGTMAIGKLVGPLTGAVGNLTNVPEGLIKSANDPTQNSNKARGTLWANYTSGELYACTDPATDNNVWTNIGDGSGTIRPNVVPGMPNGVALSGEESTSNVTSHTFAGGTDTGHTNSDIAGAVTHYVVSNISDASALQVAAAEVAAGQPHVFTTGAVDSDTDVTFDVQSKDNEGALSAARQITFTVNNFVLTYTVASSTNSTLSTGHIIGNYKYHVFNQSGTFTISQAGNDVGGLDYLVIAGGGSGGMSTAGGGGGAGGYRNSYNNETSGRGSSSETALTTMTASTYTITVGAGGPGRSSAPWASDGDDSSISGTGVSITSLGGGAGSPGRSGYGGGSNGGSGGGGSDAITASQPGGAGTSNQGYDGGNAAGTNSTYTAGGGGGAGSVGQPGVGGSGGQGGQGGGGLTSSITNSAVTRAGGGGGSVYNGTQGSGGSGGGGRGSQYTSSLTPLQGDINTGSGGGGGDRGATTHRNGGSGIVVIRYRYQ